MANIPALIPSSRLFTPGDYPNTAFTALSGLEGRVRHSNVMLGSRLRLGFRSITEAELLELLAHYDAQHGQYAPFPIPSSFLTGVSAAGDYTLQNYQWRYVDAPVVVDIPCAGHNVTLELESVPAVGAAVISTLQRVVQVLFDAAGVSGVANGIQATIDVSIDDAGAGAGGANLTVTVGIDAGVASAGAAVSGINQSIAVSIADDGVAAANGLDEEVTFTFAVEVTAGFIPVNSITYSQSSVWSGSTPADNAIMTDKSFTNTGAATGLNNPAWIQMNLGAEYTVAEVVIGTGTGNIPGGWSKFWTENRNVQYSTDGTTWTTAFNTGSFAADGIYTFAVDFNAQYIRIASSGSDYVTVSEFYALATGQTY